MRSNQPTTSNISHKTFFQQMVSDFSPSYLSLPGFRRASRRHASASRDDARNAVPVGSAPRRFELLRSNWPTKKKTQTSVHNNKRLDVKVARHSLQSPRGPMTIEETTPSQVCAFIHSFISPCVFVGPEIDCHHCVLVRLGKVR